MGDKPGVVSGKHDGRAHERFFALMSARASAVGRSDPDAGHFTHQNRADTCPELQWKAGDFIRRRHAGGGANDELFAANLDVATTGIEGVLTDDLSEFVE